MKQVLVLRHANYISADILSEDGTAASEKLSRIIGSFALVFASPTDRGKKTASIVSGQEPSVDPRAGTPKLPTERRERIRELQQSDPLGIVGVLRSDPELSALARDAGELLVSLIHQALTELEDGQRALIVTHDGTMVAAEQILNGEDFEDADHTYGELQGYVVDEELHVHQFAA